MMFLIDSKLIKDMNFTSHVMKNVNLIDVNNKITNFYVNYIIKINDENVFVQTYVINDLIVEIFLNVNVIENYNMNILTFERMIIVSNSKISMTFDKIENIMINHIIIESIISILISSFKSIKFKRIASSIDSFKFAFFTSSFSCSTFRINFSFNSKAIISQKIDKKQIQNKIRIHKCQRCFKIFCLNNEFHKHIVSIHNEFRRRHFSERNHRFKNFVDF